MRSSSRLMPRGGEFPLLSLCQGESGLFEVWPGRVELARGNEEFLCHLFLVDSGCVRSFTFRGMFQMAAERLMMKAFASR